MTISSASDSRVSVGGADGVAPQRSLADGLAGHSNSFGVIRLVLATVVIFCHAFPIGGWGIDPVTHLTRGQENSGGIAVLGFFAISGYLIAKSGMNADGLQFLWRRVLRIFPAFYVSLIAAAFIVGPIAWLMVGRPLGTYFNLGPQGPFAYLLHDADLWMRQYGVNDVFAATTPYGRENGPVFNGSLWTLSYEFGAYLIIFVLVITGILKRAKFMVPVLTGFYLIVQIAHELSPQSGRLILPTFGDNYRVSLPLIFLFGACLAVYSRKVPLDWRLGVFSGIVATITLAAGGLTILGFPAIAYFVIWLAAVLPRRLHWIGQKNDYSYGMYVYGFLVEQFTAFLGWYKWGYIPWVFVVIVITAGCAWLSWHGVEKRALQLKDMGPGRGFQYWKDRAGAVGERRRAARASASQHEAPRGESLQPGDAPS